MSKKLTTRNTSAPKRNKENEISAKKSAQQAQDKKRLHQIMIGGGIGLVVVILITVGLIAYYGDSVVARVNGINIRGTEVSAQLGVASGRFGGNIDDSFTFERDVREEAARIVALNKLYEDFGRGMGLSFGRNATPWSIVNDVTSAIIEDPAVFADFARFMPEAPVPATEQAQAILDRLHAGEDFDTLMHTYSEDGGLHSHPDGYTFIEGQMVEEFTEGTLALEIGEISGLIPTNFGYHIIMRIEPDPDNVFNNVEAELEDLLAAKHILIMYNDGASESDLMQQAVAAGFQEKMGNANIVFRGALDRVE